MSRPKTVKSKTKSKVAPSESKTPVKLTPAAKPATPESTPDQNASKEHRAESHQDSPAEENPWSEWLWSEEGQMCYRGRKDIKGEWEYDFAPLPPAEKERPYTPSREEPIEYLIEELKIIWAPKLIDVPGGNIPTVTPVSATERSKAGDDSQKVKVDEDKSAEDKENKASKGDETESKASAPDEQPEKPKKERHAVKRGRQLERPERKHLNHKERKEKVEGWRKGLE